MGLVLSREHGESVEIEHGGEKIVVTLLSSRAGRARLLFEAPESVRILRTEVQAGPVRASNVAGGCDGVV